MAFTSPSDIIIALAAAPDIQHIKSGFASQLIGLMTSLWRATGTPAQGAIPGAWAICDNTLLGCYPLPSKTGPQARALLYMDGTFPIQNGFVMPDRLGHMGGLNGTLTTAQTVNGDVSVGTSNLALRRGVSDFTNVRWFLEWYTATGVTGINATCAVTYSDNSTGNIVVALPASVAAGRMIEIPTPGPLAIKSIQSVTLSATTGTAGSFGVTAMRVLASPTAVSAIIPTSFDWPQLGLTPIEDSACLFPVLLAIGSTNVGTTVARLKIGVQ